MVATEITKMRKKQFLVVNVLFIVSMLILFLILNGLAITFPQVFMASGVFLLLQSFYELSKRDSTSSLFPIFTRIGRYEQKKLGSEWKIKKRTSLGWNFFLSGIMFLQAFWTRKSNGEFVIEPQILLVLCLVFILIINGSLYFHIRRVDNWDNPRDLKRFTRKFKILGVAAGLIIALVLVSFLVFYIVTTT